MVESQNNGLYNQTEIVNMEGSYSWFCIKYTRVWSVSGISRITDGSHQAKKKKIGKSNEN